MIVGIDINDVLRAYTKQFLKINKKYRQLNDTISYGTKEYWDEVSTNGMSIDYNDINEDDVVNFDFTEQFNFKSEKEFKEFLYKEASFEICGCAEAIDSNIGNTIQSLIIDLNETYDNNVSLSILSKEFNTTIPATYYFLSKISCKIPEVHFTKSYDDIWNYCDILITANPYLISSIPENKKCIKISKKYNKNTECDLTYDSFNDVFNSGIINKVIDKLNENIK